jgi:hypothetical protein
MKAALKHVRYVLGSMSAVLFSASAGEAWSLVKHGRRLASAV